VSLITPVRGHSDRGNGWPDPVPYVYRGSKTGDDEESPHSRQKAASGAIGTATIKAAADARKARYRELRAQGMEPAEAAAEVGVSLQSAMRRYEPRREGGHR
jgi:hypothetical protein